MNTRVDVPSCVTPCIARNTKSTCAGSNGSGSIPRPDTRVRACVVTCSISRTSRGSKRLPPAASVAIAEATCSIVKLL